MERNGRGPPRSVRYLAVVLMLSVCPWALGAELFADLKLGGYATDNVYLTSQKEGDGAFEAGLDLGVDFAEYWTAGYMGSTGIHIRHTDLFVHQHEVYFYAGPAWGAEDENELFVELSAQTQQNADAYSSIDYLKPALEVQLALEPAHWFRCTLREELSYRWFYEDAASSSFDSWTSGDVLFTFQSRTTLSPRLAYGFRYYPQQDTDLVDDTVDQQLRIGAQASQGLWPSAGLQAEYAYTRAVGESGLILRKLTMVEFSYIGEAFLYSGHLGRIGFKQIFEQGWRFGLELVYESRDYHGWTAQDSDGNDTDQDRADTRLSPSGWAEYVWWPGDDRSSAVPEISVRAEYTYLRQWSNDAWYDTDRHLFSLDLELTW